MNVNTIYGTEEISARFLTEIKDRGFSIDSLLEGDSESAVEAFVKIAMQMDYLTGDDDSYYANIGNLSLELAQKHPEFYERLVKRVEGLDKEMVPPRAALIFDAL